MVKLHIIYNREICKFKKEESNIMLFPNIQNMNTEIKINKDKIFSLLLASIAFEQLSLSRIINGEVEKVKYIIDILENNSTQEIPTVEELIQINTTARKIFRTVINNHILLQLKLEDVLDIATTKATTATAINDITSAPNTTSITTGLCSSISTEKISANRGVSILLEPLLYNNVQANKNIAINYNSINSNVIKTTKTGLNISINTSIPYQDERL